MARPEQHKCLFCGAFFRADLRNAKHQNYCSEPGCRKASKAASRHAWLAKVENQDYFRGPENVARVQAWRAEHPGYWRRPKGQRGISPEASLALQDLCPTQAVEIVDVSKDVPPPALQDLLLYQPAVLIVFIAQFTGSTLQDDIARSTRRLIELGHDILAGRIGDDPKRVLCPARLRQIPAQFSWVDHRLVRERYIERCDPLAMALYLFLVTVGDEQGLSYYADATLARCLSMTTARLSQARGDLVRIGLIAYQRPLYQVLSLDKPLKSEVREPTGDDIGVRIGQLRAALGRAP